MKKRDKAILWWIDLGSATKTRLCDINTEFLGKVRRWESLTGREIEKLYEKEHENIKEL